MKTAEPKVELVSFTANALELLLYTKAGRLGHNVNLQDIIMWPKEEKLNHLDYMMKTIQTSFEFVHYIFKISNVSRSFTHQLVRTRDASYQQESQRTVNVRDNTVSNPLGDNNIYEFAIDSAMTAYSDLVEAGFPVQDAREVLPTAIHTNIFVKANLRTLARMAEVRLCKRTQGQYQDVFKMMKALITNIHPYFEPMLNVACVKTGICIFPNYTKCPVQKYTIRVTDKQKAKIKEAWSTTDHVANPIAKDGRTM